ncbi:GIN domain-containing protein [Mariniflexile aquimaris]|uniref:GIN domain-containing protein n=1 Tax=Mariniflexile aquimaris TaxID=881009 RepID=A0ABW3BP79_9FLAO
MKIVLYALTILISFTVTAQKKQKVKGNKEVIEVQDNLPPFNQIEIMDGLEVTLMQTSTSGYRLKTDSNLVNVIKINVLDSILHVYSTHKITSSKTIEIDIDFLNLDQIVIHEDSKLTGKNLFNLNALTMSTDEGSNFELDLKTNALLLQMNGSAKGKLNLNADTTKITLNDKAFLKGTISSNKLETFLKEKSDMTIEGDTEDFNIQIAGSSNMKANNLKATNAFVNAANSSDIAIYASKNLNLYAKGKSNIYVYGNPEIKVEGLNDKSQIIKK